MQRNSARPVIADHRHAIGRGGAALWAVERVTAAALCRALERLSPIWNRLGFSDTSAASKHENQQHRRENLSHRYSQTPSKHSIARPLTDRQQGVLAVHESPRYPHGCGFGDGSGLPPHPSKNRSRITAGMSPDASADSKSRSAGTRPGCRASRRSVVDSRQDRASWSRPSNCRLDMAWSRNRRPGTCQSGHRQAGNLRLTRWPQSDAPGSGLCPAC